MVSPITDPDAAAFASPQRLRVEGDDARADNRRRAIDVARETIIIHRIVARVTMTIRVPAIAYRGVALRVTGLRDGGGACEVRLAHRDPDLCVVLAVGDDRAAIEARWREWVGFFGLPALVVRIEAGALEASLEVVEIEPRPPRPRRGGKASTPRRPRFLARRKVGRPSFPAAVHANPRVLFPGSNFDR
jgi:hypothetical protein